MARSAEAEALAEIDEELGPLLEDVYEGEGLADFIRRVSPRLPPPPHLDPLIAILESVRSGPPIRQLVSWPPRHAKTMTVLHGLTWMIARNPYDKNAYVTYGDRLSRKKSSIARRLAMSAGVNIPLASRNVADWHTAQGGGLIATSIGGPLSGEGVNGLLVLDDPYKNREDADSGAYREMTEEWFREVALTRLEHGSVLVIHTRWREDDIIGKLAQEEGWSYLNVPALAEENDPIGRKPGEALWPELYSAEFLHKQKRAIGEWSFDALYQGRPRPRGAHVFGEPRWYDPKSLKLDGMVVFIGADPAASAKSRSNHSVGIALAIHGQREKRTAYVLDVIRGQWTIPEFSRRLQAFQMKWYGAAAAVEAVGGFKAVPQIMREANPALRVMEVFPSQDKFQRAQPLAAAWNDNRVLLPTGAPWTGEFVKEYMAFTGVDDAEDDQVDAGAHAWNIGMEQPAVHRGAVASPGRWR